VGDEGYGLITPSITATAWCVGKIINAYSPNLKVSSTCFSR